MNPRFFSRVSFGVVALSALSVPVACSDPFDGCDASRSCDSPKGSGGTAGQASGEAGSGGVAGVSDSSAGAAGDVDSPGGSAGLGEAGEAGTGGSGDGGAPSERDTTPPTVLSVSPTGNGVRADANIVVTFSEPMERSLTNGAYQSADLPASAVGFSWNDENTVLTIKPRSALEYAEDNDTVFDPKSYAVSIASTAEDAAGNQLSKDYAWQFETLRRIKQALSIPWQDVITFRDRPVEVDPCYGDNGPAIAGDNGFYGFFMLVPADISSLPEGIVEWESATLYGVQVGTTGAPYGTGAENLGVLKALHISPPSPLLASWTTPILRELGTFSDSASEGERSVDVRVALSEDYAERNLRGQRSQYRLSFDREMNGNTQIDWTIFACHQFSLVARYLIR